jgi:hypothetical protein
MTVVRLYGYLFHHNTSCGKVLMPRPDRIDACLPSALLQQISYAIDFTWAIPTTPFRQGGSNGMTTYQNDLMWSFLNIASLKRETES